jgi:hypothetical protein
LIMRRKWLLLGAMLLLLGSVAWPILRHQWTICKIITNNTNPQFAPGGSGFLIQTNSGTADFYNWHGEKRWSVKLPDPVCTGWTYQAPSYSLSSNGSDLVVCTPHGSAFLIQHWHNGKLLGDEIIPCMHPDRLTTKTQCIACFVDNHIVLVQLLDSRNTILALLRDGKLLTRSQYKGNIFMAQDGRHLIDTHTMKYYLPVIKNKSFSLHPVKFTLNNDDFGQCELVNDTLTVDPPGPSKPWTMHIPNYFYPMSNQTMSISNNGQYVAFLYYRHLPKKLLECLVRLKINTDGDAYRLEVGIYNCKGKPVATKTLRTHYIGSEPMWVEPLIWGISPDGKAVLLGTIGELNLNRYGSY